MSKVNDGSTDYINIIRMPKTFQLSFVYFMQAISRGTFVTFMVTYLIEEGMSFKIASGAFSLIGFGYIPGTVLSGIASDRFRRPRLLASLLFIEALSIGSILLVQQVIPIYGFVVMFGFSLLGVVTVMSTIPSEYYDARIYGRVLGLLTLIFGIGVTISPYVGGVIADLSGSPALALWILGVVPSIIGGIAALFIK